MNMVQLKRFFTSCNDFANKCSLVKVIFRGAKFNSVVIYYIKNTWLFLYNVSKNK